ncbi:ATP-dependent translocase ABCB1-like isoform X1 [Branchiostoma floridae]|uniref:ATP-dependent translocase ABCB1-like isoform X1 n=1 Tax=Branchiostoma floridae TaxID=7739 RepID=A0A9J7LS17_BRAFL|nr:ATP-dependent translocase ABCB1-like isoform X1 [Branchiostoma floridae]XP_035688019.1 ATP-dependent translocase ABCB1-like isoform X1 [Branchiostoma floridae]
MPDETDTTPGGSNAGSEGGREGSPSFERPSSSGLKQANGMPSVEVPEGITEAPPDYYDVAVVNGKNKNGAAAPVSADTIIPVEKDKEGEKKEGEDEEKKKEDDVKPIGVFEVFRFADGWDICLILLGSLLSIGLGITFPLMIIVFGDTTTSFVSSELASELEEMLRCFGNLIPNITSGALPPNIEQYLPPNCTHLLPMLNASSENLATGSISGISIADLQQGIDIEGQMTTYAYYYVAIACGAFVCAYGQVAFWTLSATRQVNRIRTKFFRAIMRQDVGWHDTHATGEFSTRLADDVNKINEGISDKCGIFLQWFTAFIAGFVIGFIYGWKMALVIMAVSPLLGIVAFLMTKMASAFTEDEQAAYAKAGGVAEEVLSSMRTVAAFGGEKKEEKRYNVHLVEAMRMGVKKAISAGAGMGVTFLVMFGVYALAFWYGSDRVRAGEYTPGGFLITFFCVVIGAMSLGQAAPNIESFAKAKGAAAFVYSVIDNEPVIDSLSEEGHRPDSLKGNIEFKDVNFTYPARPDVPVLQGLSLKADVGQTVALVGSSGCGKSTTVQLIQRFYDPQEGVVELDGQDIRSLNIQWLRQHIGVVSQEPILFATTIAENIRYGREDVTQAEIEKAAQEANAHDFISKLPQTYETLVGERGAQLSGGQKQRIAIARALVRDPRILLLDEATSALDTESEATVQAALDKARMGRTTIVVAHRLSTIKTADIIVGFENGVAVEQGTHDQLMAQQGVYYTLVTTQTFATEDEEEDEETGEVYAEEDLMSEDLAKKSSVALTRQMSARKLERTMSATSKKSVKDEEEEEEVPDPDMGRVMKLNTPEWPYILVGTFCAAINGAVNPCFAILFAEVLGAFGIADPVEQEKKTTLYALLFLAIGGGSMITMFLQGYCYGKSGEMLTMRLRQMGFSALLRQEIGYFDDHQNNTGALTTRLAVQASQVQGATGARLGTIVQNIFNLGVAVILAFIYGWQLTLLCLAFVPFMIFAGFLQMRMLAGYSSEEKKAVEDAGKTAVEAVENIRTVASLSLERKFCDIYADKLKGPFQKSQKKAHITGLGFAFSQCIIYFAYAAIFRFGAWLVANGHMNFRDVFLVLGAIIFGAMAIGQASSFAPDYAKAKSSATKMFQLFDRQPAIDSSSEEGEKPQSCEGEVSFRDVQFAYPTREKVTVLKQFSTSVSPGETLALVGSSGCGKSTSVQLLERFYEALSGNVMIDGKDIRTLNIQWLRKQMGIVSQEPILFNTTIRENIAYGDNEREVTQAEIEAAAQAANIHNFITSLPDGYETNTGEKGTQLSGGQKQRIAIARALVRNPKILLLDEATSALDTESEKVVQEALDRAREGRTSIVIAHRLSTIFNADKIAVIHHGKVQEIGKHQELLANKGLYYKLVNAQMQQS